MQPKSSFGESKI